MREVLAVSVSCALALACGDDGIDYEGDPGTAVPCRIEFWTPSVEVDVEGGPGGWFLIDTGAPFTMLDTDSYSELEDGLHDLELGAFGLRFPSYEVVAFDALPFDQGDEPLDGIIGGDLLGHFTLSVDYRGELAWLDDGWDGTLPAEVDTGGLTAPIQIGAEVAGGGLALVPGDCEGGCGTFDIPATRILVQATIEGEAEPIWALVDTGASAVVLAEELLDRLGPGVRPRLDGVTVGTATGVVTAYFTRVWSLRLEGQGGTGTVDLPNVSALVLPGESLFTFVSDETGRNVEALIGGSYLRYFLTGIDYGGEALQLAEYSEPSHVDPNEFIGPGFSLARSGDRWVLSDVYEDTDAKAKGLRRNEEVAELDATAIGALSQSEVDAILDGFALGELVPVGLMRGSDVETVDVEVEDLLPDYEEP